MRLLGSFVYSQSHVNVSARLTIVGSLAVGAFDLVNYSLSVVGFVSLTLVPGEGYSLEFLVGVCRPHLLI